MEKNKVKRQQNERNYLLKNRKKKWQQVNISNIEKVPRS